MSGNNSFQLGATYVIRDSLPETLCGLKGNRVRLEQAGKNKQLAEDAINYLYRGRPSVYCSLSNLCEVANRAEAKLEQLLLHPSYRANARCSYRPEGVWAKASPTDDMHPALVLVRDTKYWCLDFSNASRNTFRRGEVLYLTESQHIRVREMTQSRYVLRK